jgi:hypothetical protein
MRIWSVSRVLFTTSVMAGCSQEFKAAEDPAGTGGTAAAGSGGDATAGGSANAAGTAGAPQAGAGGTAGAPQAGAGGTAGAPQAGTGGTAGAPQAGTGGTAPLNCVERILDPTYGDNLVEVFTTAGTHDFSGSCGGDVAANDYAYQWVVPFAGWFTLDTAGSDFDAVLYLLEEGCQGDEFACNADSVSAGRPSVVNAEFNAGDQYVIVLDGAWGSKGNAVLSINPVECPKHDVGDGTALPASYNTAGGQNDHGGACGGDGNNERSYRFTPSESGLWRIAAKPDPSDSLNPALYVEDGALCGGELLQCNASDGVSASVPASVARYLTAGQSVSIVVDSKSGTGHFELSATKLSETCTADVLQQELIVATMRDYPDIMTSSCGANGDTGIGAFSPYADYVFFVDDLQPGGHDGCQLDIDAGFPFALSVMSGECTGRELHCALSSTTSTDRHHAGYPLPKLGERLTVVVSPTVPFYGGFENSDIYISKVCFSP